MNELPEDFVRRELSNGEQLVWSGRPPLGLMLRPADALLIPFTVFGGAPAIFWVATDLANGAPLPIILFSVPFVFVLLYVMVGRFWVDAWRRAEMVYAVTNKRVIIASGWPKRFVNSQPIDALTDVSLCERSDGGGTIAFGPVFPMFKLLYCWWLTAGRWYWPEFDHGEFGCFELPKGARAVYSIIGEARRAAKQRPA